MGVINSAGIIGIIDNSSPNYSTVISILNVQSKINAKIKKSNHFGSLVWNGKSTGFVQLIDVPRLAGVRKGDTIVTGGQSAYFSRKHWIGTIDKVYIDDETNYYTLDIKLV
jgi:rod shape-determining protein MreC